MEMIHASIRMYSCLLVLYCAPIYCRFIPIHVVKGGTPKENMFSCVLCVHMNRKELHVKTEKKLRDYLG